MTKDEILGKIDFALSQKGFQLDKDQFRRWEWNGSLEVAGSSLPVSLIIRDLNLVALPTVLIQDLDALPARNHPHIDPTTGFLCYADSRSIVLDRYLPGQMVLRCLEIAEEALNDIVSGKLDSDFPDEFSAYWDGEAVLVDLPEGFSGEAMLRLLRLQEGHTSNFFYTDRRRLTPWHRENLSVPDPKGASPPKVEVLVLEEPILVPLASTWPPETLADVLDWLESSHRGLSKKYLSALFKKRSELRLVAFHAPNGFFVIGVSVPKHYRTPEFLEHRPESLNRILRKQKASIPVTRYFGKRLDKRFLYQRNLGKMQGLKDKSVLLIGCGTIGSFLSQMLVQAGVGSSDGKKLTLVDHDILKAPNIGRHLLGMPYIDRNKAEACKEHLQAHHPEANVKAVSAEIFQAMHLFYRHDIVIDATGEEALSCAINEELIGMGADAPPILHLWLEGNGAVGRGLFFEVGEGACYKCLRPDSLKPERFPVMHKKATTEKVETLSCGDETHIPFPVSRSMQAAGLGLDMLLDYVNGNPNPKLRTRPYDASASTNRPDKSPDPAKDCPACQKTSASGTLLTTD
ncbi:MAG: ThiF family adenylyltransferase [Magnetovibrionaceae bacterium]